MIYRLLIIVLATVSLAACMSAGERELIQGRQAYQRHDYQNSVGHVIHAAMTGNAQAQYVLGYMYYYGQGVPRDPQAAQYWIGESAKRGYTPANIALKMFSQSHYEPPQPSGGQVIFSPVPVDLQASPAQNKAAKLKKLKSSPKPKQNQHKKTLTRSTHHKAKKLNNTAKKSLPFPSYLMLARDKKHLLALPVKNYTIQLLGVRKLNDASQFVNQHQLSDKMLVYRTTYHNKPWFVVIYGNYRSQHDALSALKQLPRTIRASCPWVKSIAAIHKELSQ